MEPQTSRTPLIMLVVGVGSLVLAIGLVGGFLLAGGASGGDEALEGPGVETTTTTTEPPTTTTTEPPTTTTTTEPPTTTTTEPPTTTTTEPTTTTTTEPPTTTTTVPEVTSPKFHYIFRAEGGSVNTNARTALPFRRLEASWDNSYRDCPNVDCIRGRASAAALVGPFGTAESPVASAQVYNTFVARRASAELIMDVRWKGNLVALVGANATTKVDIEIFVRELDASSQPVKTVPGTPFLVLSESVGNEAIAGYQNLDLDGSRQVTIPMQNLNVNATYRVDLKVTCDTRVAFSASATGCNFWADGDWGAEWTRQIVEFDVGVCRPDETGTGCIYPAE
jgi:hypothetical protein